MAKKGKRTKKIYRKKLTNSGGGVCFAAGLAAVLSCCAAAGEFLAAVIYDQFYNNPIYPRYTGLTELVNIYGGAVVTAVFAVIMFIWALSAAKGKRLGREFGLMGIFMGAALCLAPAVRLYSLLTSDLTETKFKTGYDSDVFQGAVELAIPGLPIISGLLLFFAGIAVMARISGEDFTVKAPAAVKKRTAGREHSAGNESSEFADPHTFGGGKTVEQGLTGETKPAAHIDADDDKPPQDKPVKEESPAQTNAVIEDIPAEKSAKKPSIKLCPECGELVGEEELFCANCGHKM